MTKEEKDLLLKDLSARLPYGVKYSTIDSDFAFTLKWIDKLDRLDGEVKLENAKIFLRPMRSMTADEVLEYINLKESIIACDDTNYFFETYKSIDWLNKNMFDFRGLIPKGLANVAPEDMYNL